MVRGEESGSGSAGWRGGNASIVIVGFLLLGFDVVLKEEKTWRVRPAPAGCHGDARFKGV